MERIFRTAYGPRYPVRKEFVGPSLTKQAFLAETDINNIMRKFEKTGLIEHVNRYQGDYADVATAPDFQMALDIVMRAEEAFASLPAKVRRRFDNSPAAFLEFTANPANEAEMRELGILLPSREPAPAGDVEPTGETPAPE